MFSATADFYDAIYEFKDYAEEALKIRHVIANGRGPRPFWTWLVVQVNTLGCC